MKLPTSDKQASFMKKAHIKKGYYPAKLLKVEPFKDKEGNLREGTYGRQLIFEFAIYESEDSGKPIKPMTFVDKQENAADKTEDVIIPKFVYHEYKNRKTGEFQTAITPNSAITKTLKALGWEFSGEGVDIDPLIGNWVEVNVDDYEQKSGDETYTASTIKDINPYKGPDVGNVPDAEKKEPKEVKKQVKHKEVVSKDAEILKNKIKTLEELNKEGNLTAEGLKQAKEQIESQLEELKKK